MRSLQWALARGAAQRSGPMAVGLVILAAGVAFGALGVGALGSQDRLELINLVSGHFAALGQGSRGGESTLALLRVAVFRNLQLMAFMWVLGLTVVGTLGALGILFFRGFAAGFAAGFLGSQLGWKGMVYALAALLPHNLLALPALICAGAGTLEFAVATLRGRGRRSRSDFYRQLWEYTVWMAAAAALALGGALVEAVVTPGLMRLAAQL